MSCHLPITFAILAIFCAMTLSGKIEEHDDKKLPHIGVIDIDKSHHGMDHGLGHDHLDLHKLPGLDRHHGHGDHHGWGHDHDHDDDHKDHHGHDHGHHNDHDHHDHGHHNDHEDHHDHGHHNDHEDHHDHGHDHGHHHCPKNEMWSKCGGRCQATCKNRNPVCPLVCIGGCVCNKGLLRNSHGQCVEKCHC